MNTPSSSDFDAANFSQDSPSPTAQGTQPPAEILIAEDSMTQAMKLQNILEKRGFHVTWANNGRRALDELQNTEKQNPHLLITDVQMPEMDGYELCERVKKSAELREIPVILLTSLSAPEDIIRGLECGADNFIVKPYDEEFLLSRIRNILLNQQLRTARAHLGAEETSVPIFFAGKKYTITSDRRQILDLLLTTYETAVKTNRELIKTHEELKAAQAQLIEMEKLQSVERLAAGVAHEVRNPLAILEMGITFLAEKTDDEDRPILDQMSEAVQRANAVIMRLMELSSPQEMGMREVALREIIEGAVRVFSDELAREKIEVHTDLGAEKCFVRVDAGKLEQAFLNLLSNARDAMATKGGTLTVKTTVKQLQKAEVTFDAGGRSGVRLRAGDTVAVTEIIDTGSGILPGNLTKIFEPFFSTKPTGKGTGLGLTVAKKIIELHGGELEIRNCEPSDGAGVRARVLLKCQNCDAP